MMSARKRRLNKGSGIATSSDTRESREQSVARSLLKKHVVHTRDIPNGRDFLFLGPKDALRDALKIVVELENGTKRFSSVDFASVDEYFLLRITGPGSVQRVIMNYFE